jgi:hypothetical protein
VPVSRAQLISRATTTDELQSLLGPMISRRYMHGCSGETDTDLTKAMSTVFSYDVAPHIFPRTTQKSSNLPEVPLLAVEKAEITKAITECWADSAHRKTALGKLDEVLNQYQNSGKPASHSSTGYCAEVYPSVGVE